MTPPPRSPGRSSIPLSLVHFGREQLVHLRPRIDTPLSGTHEEVAGHRIVDTPDQRRVCDCLRRHPVRASAAGPASRLLART
jgi:hypothetical protein